MTKGGEKRLLELLGKINDNLATLAASVEKPPQSRRRTMEEQDASIIQMARDMGAVT